MKRTKDKAQEPAFEKGSGNVFADLGLDDADERFTRAKLGIHVYQLLIGRKLKQREIGELLAIKQPEVSHLLNGHFNRVLPPRQATAGIPTAAGPEGDDSDQLA